MKTQDHSRSFACKRKCNEKPRRCKRQRLYEQHNTKAENHAIVENSSYSILELYDDFTISNMKLNHQKTRFEKEFLETQFSKDPSWSRKTVQLCKTTLNMKTHQVYKWGYDRKKTLEKQQNSLALQPQNTAILSIIAMDATKRELLICRDLNSFVKSLVESFEAHEEGLKSNQS